MGCNLIRINLDVGFLSIATFIAAIVCQIATATADWQSCGVLHASGLQRTTVGERISADMCSRLFLTNCSTPQDEVQLCPNECPFLSRSLYSQCGAACVKAEQCGAHRRAYVFANNATRQCEQCPSFGCASCETYGNDASKFKCFRCRHGFTLSASGDSCLYEYDSVLAKIYIAAAVFLAFVLGLSVLALARCKNNGDVLKRGLDHRNRCLPHQVETAPCTSNHTFEADVIFHSRAPLYPLTVDVHSQSIVGVGLALYYNHLVFVAIVAASCWVVLKFGEDYFGLYQWSVVDCGYGSEDDADMIMVAYSRRRFAIALFCWAVLLPGSIIFARYQKMAERTFDDVHTLMEDYTLAVRGLPPTTTNPRDVQKWIEKLIAGPIIGVSIAYDYRHARREIDELLDQHIAGRDLAFEAALGVPSARYRSSPREGALPSVNEEAELLTNTSRCGEYSPRIAWDCSSITPQQGPADLLTSLRGSGEAFIVMRREADVERVFALWDEPGLHRSGSFFSMHSGPSASTGWSPPVIKAAGDQDPRLFEGVHKLELRVVKSEPTSVIWDQVGVSDSALVRRVIIAVASFMVVAVAFNCLLYAPYFQYVLEYARRVGEPPTALQTSGLGVLVSLGNTLIANIIWLGVPRLGFQRKDQADIVTFVVRWLLVSLNTVILVVLTARKLSAIGVRGEGSISGDDQVFRRSEELGREAALASNIVVLFLTGGFSVSYVCFWCSFPLTFWQAVLTIKSGILGSTMSVRDCERLLEPMEIWLPWDYAGHLQLTCCAFIPLFLAEPPGQCAARRLCAVLFVWCGVMYCAQRVVHLRFSKETFFTTGRLDRAVLVAWAVPVAQLAAAAVFWACRAFHTGVLCKVILCIFAFLGSCCLYWFLLWHSLKHQSLISALHTTKEPYQKALARLRYSYFNTNPIHVLSGDHCPERGIKKTAAYQSGKAYLQAADPKVHARLEASLTAAEINPQRGQRLDPGVAELMYRARVWLTGAPRQAFEPLDGDDGRLTLS